MKSLYEDKVYIMLLTKDDMAGTKIIVSVCTDKFELRAVAGKMLRKLHCSEKAVYMQSNAIYKSAEDGDRKRKMIYRTYDRKYHILNNALNIYITILPTSINKLFKDELPKI